MFRGNSCMKHILLVLTTAVTDFFGGMRNLESITPRHNWGQLKNGSRAAFSFQQGKACTLVTMLTV